MRLKYRHFICGAAALALMSGCGQKGPLYLPDKNAKKPVVASPDSPPDASRPPEKIDPEKKDDSQKPPSP